MLIRALHSSRWLSIDYLCATGVHPVRQRQLPVGCACDVRAGLADRGKGLETVPIIQVNAHVLPGEACPGMAEERGVVAAM